MYCMANGMNNYYMYSVIHVHAMNLQNESKHVILKLMIYNTEPVISTVHDQNRVTKVLSKHTMYM